MAGSMASKAACQAGGYFLQRTDSSDFFIGNDLRKGAAPVRGRPLKHDHPAPCGEVKHTLRTVTELDEGSGEAEHNGPTDGEHYQRLRGKSKAITKSISPISRILEPCVAEATEADQSQSSASLLTGQLPGVRQCRRIRCIIDGKGMSTQWVPQHS